MAEVRLSDVVVPEVYYKYMSENSPVKSALWESGILKSDDKVSEFLNGGGTTFNVPFWGDLADEDANIVDDNPANMAVHSKLSAQKQTGVRCARHKSWSAMNLSAELSGASPRERVMARIVNWWQRANQKTLIAVTNGIIASNIANNAGDMLLDRSQDVAPGSVTDDMMIGSKNILDAAQTMGDAKEDLSVIAMHSILLTKLKKDNLIDFIPDSDGKVNFPTYLGYRVIEDDGMPFVVLGNGSVQHTVALYAPGSFCWADGVPDSPALEHEREASAGNGGGQDIIHSRRSFCIHPQGFTWKSPALAGPTPANSEFSAAASWERQYDRKNVPMAFLRVNG